MKVPFQVELAESIEKRHEQMLHAISLGLQRLKPVSINPSRWVSIACFGPTLRKTWGEINDQNPLITVSGAHDFLLEKGVTPEDFPAWYHIDCDPRKYKSRYVSNPRKGIQYLMSSTCHPRTWEYLKGQDIKLWHMHNGKSTEDFVRENDPEGLLVHGGSTVGLQAMHVAGCLGFRCFDFYGMDGNFEGEDFRASPTQAAPQKIEYFEMPKGRIWKTTDIMINALVEILTNIDTYDILVRIHGDSLVKACVEDAGRLKLEQMLKAA